LKNMPFSSSDEQNVFNVYFEPAMPREFDLAHRSVGHK